MEASTASEIHVCPQFFNAIRSLPAPAADSGNNFTLEINVVVKHTYSCGERILEDYISGTRCACRYESLSWDTVDNILSDSDFPYPLERIKWDPAGNILENKTDLIRQILEFAHMVQNVTPPFQDDDIVYMSLVFVKEVSVSPQQFQLTKERIIATTYEYRAEILWGQIYDKINRLGQGSSLYEEFQRLDRYMEDIVEETAHWGLYVDENYERELLHFLIEEARREFRSLPGSEAYSMPCRHRFHFDCIETWLLKNPSCPMCRYKLPPTESK